MDGETPSRTTNNKGGEMTKREKKFNDLLLQLEKVMGAKITHIHWQTPERKRVFKPTCGVKKIVKRGDRPKIRKSK